MGKVSYVCVTCGEDFTRRYGAYRHNDNIHNGRGKIVGWLEYLIGRSCGQYLPPDPSLYRQSRKRTNKFRAGYNYDNSRANSTTTARGGFGSPLTNLACSTNTFASKRLVPQASHSKPSAETAHNTRRYDHSTGFYEDISKIEEIKTLLLPHCLVEDVNRVVSSIILYVSYNHESDFLDSYLLLLRGFLGPIDFLTQLSSSRAPLTNKMRRYTSSISPDNNSNSTINSADTARNNYHIENHPTQFQQLNYSPASYHSLGQTGSRKSVPTKNVTRQGDRKSKIKVGRQILEPPIPRIPEILLPLVYRGQKYWYL
jgi:hypothetical protein